jgi:beta-mannosidase
MSGRLRACDAYHRTALGDGWEVGASVTAGACSADSGVRWLPASVPGTVAGSLRDSGQWSFDSTPRQFDAEEWWYRVRFAAEPAAQGERVTLGLDGLATFAQVRLNGTTLVDSANMFVEHRCDVSALLQSENELVIRFSPLDAFLNVRRRRPRWRTPMVQHQQLRWVRTSLLGRTPGWTPPAAPVGPWRPVWLERRRWVDIGEHRLQANVVGDSGRLTLACALSPFEGVTLKSARLIAQRQGQRQGQGQGRRIESTLNLQAHPSRAQGELTLPDVELWWPHTHGEPALYHVALILDIEDSAGQERRIEADLGSVGFRTLRLDRESGRFALIVNGSNVFCRGAAWTPLDCVSLQATGTDYRDAIERVRNGGMNMLRVPGPLVYETDEFLDCCDAAGIMVWQDFMFANMDYPAEDAAFASSVQTEVRQQLSRLQARPALALLCGNSEGAQQAAMSGAARECWSPPLFEADLASLAAEFSPDVPYCPSSTHGGAFPFQANEGATSYYGVGAYFKPLTDARRSEVRFASECLAFANVPEDETLALITPGRALRCHHARWKERVPRDLGAGWDFDDVRDHYMERLFRVNALQLRYADHDRYLRLGRVISGEVMAATFAEWRRAGSSCSGALVWFLADLWPGAGWGVIDSTGLPKAAYYYLKRVLQPLAVFVTDEDCNGLVIHIVNEATTAARVRLELQMFRFSTPVGAPAVRGLSLEAASATQIRATDLYEGFLDLSYSYRFGPPSYDVLRAALLLEGEDTLLAQAFHFPQGLPNSVGIDVGLTAAAVPHAGAWRLQIFSKGFAQSVHVDVPGFVADDQYFHMIPNSTRTLMLRPRKSPALDPPQGVVHALNAASPGLIAVAS